VIVAGAGLFACYLAQARTVVVNSDPASLLLQAQDMLHGNVLLHGWVLADVTFYTTELPEYAMVSLIDGFGPNAVHVGAALTYTLLVLLAALLARGRGRGPGGLARALVAGGILLAPGLGRATNQLLGAPDHLGTAVPILAVLLLIDLAPARWWVPALAGLGLAWSQVGDPLTLYAACIPLAVAGAVRAIGRRSAYDAWLFVAAVASVGLARVVLALVRAAGGFAGNSVPGGLLAPLSAAGHHAWVTGESVLLLFGADFWDPGSAFVKIVAIAHFTGVALALAALAAGVAGFFRLKDRICDVLTGGLVVLLVAGVFGTHLEDFTFAHEIAVVLPFGAVLAGRLVAPRLLALGGSAPGRSAKFAARGAAGVLGASLAVCLAGLGYAAAQPAATPASLPLARWLEARGLHEGLSGYWEGSSVMLESGQRVHLAVLRPDGAGAYQWESKTSWYDPQAHDANFVIVSSPSVPDTPDSRSYPAVPVASARAVFGTPARTYSYDGYQIWVYDRNLLTGLAPEGG
jgi:hypothetical protein